MAIPVCSCGQVLKTLSQEAESYNAKQQVWKTRQWNVKRYLEFLVVWETDFVAIGWNTVYGVLALSSLRILFHDASAIRIELVAALIIGLMGLLTINLYNTQLTLMVAYSLVAMLGFTLLVFADSRALLINAILSIAGGGIANLLIGVISDSAILVTAADDPYFSISPASRLESITVGLLLWIFIPICASVGRANEWILTWLCWLCVGLSSRHAVARIDPARKNSLGCFAVVCGGTTTTWSVELSMLAFAITNAYTTEKTISHFLVTFAFIGLGFRLGYVCEVGRLRAFDELLEVPTGEIVWNRPGFAINSREIGSTSGGTLAVQVPSKKTGRFRRLSMIRFQRLADDEDVCTDVEGAYIYI